MQTLKQYAHAIVARLRQYTRHDWLYAITLTGMIVGGFFFLQHHITFVWNISASLPQRVFVIKKWTLPQRGDLTLFQPGTNAITIDYPSHFVKVVLGMGGDVIAHDNHTVVINGHRLPLRTHNQQGQALTPIQPQVIPPGFYFVGTTHERSFDSRYQAIGLVHQSHILGTGVAVF